MSGPPIPPATMMLLPPSVVTPVTTTVVTGVMRPAMHSVEPAVIQLMLAPPPPPPVDATVQSSGPILNDTQPTSIPDVCDVTKPPPPLPSFIRPCKHKIDSSCEAGPSKIRREESVESEEKCEECKQLELSINFYKKESEKIHAEDENQNLKYIQELKMYKEARGLLQELFGESFAKFFENYIEVQSTSHHTEDMQSLEPLQSLPRRSNTPITVSNGSSEIVHRFLDMFKNANLVSDSNKNTNPTQLPAGAPVNSRPLINSRIINSDSSTKVMNSGAGMSFYPSVNYLPEPTGLTNTGHSMYSNPIHGPSLRNATTELRSQIVQYNSPGPSSPSSDTSGYYAISTIGTNTYINNNQNGPVHGSYPPFVPGLSAPSNNTFYPPSYPNQYHVNGISSHSPGPQGPSSNPGASTPYTGTWLQNASYRAPNAQTLQSNNNSFGRFPPPHPPF